MSVRDFYDPLASYFHLVYPDWEASIKKQASQIDSVIQEVWGDKVRTILDAACGIGTQAIGLAQLGYQIVASDISPAAIERAKKEAAARGLSIPFSIADFRSLSLSQHRQFDLVIACDNAIPHLLSDDEIRLAFAEMYGCVSFGGGCLISVRDYDASESGTKVVPYGIRTDHNVRFLVFQVWQYVGKIYDLSMYFIEDNGDSSCNAHVLRTQYYAIPIARLLELMSEAGFTAVRRIDNRFFQPLIVGLKRP